MKRGSDETRPEAKKKKQFIVVEKNEDEAAPFSKLKPLQNTKSAKLYVHEQEFPPDKNDNAMPEEPVFEIIPQKQEKGNFVKQNLKRKKKFVTGYRKMRVKGELTLEDLENIPEEESDHEGALQKSDSDSPSDPSDIEEEEAEVIEFDEQESIVYHEKDLLTILKSKFGHDTFRDGQCQVIQNILSGKSTFFITATGQGKSLCYQMPALIIGGLTLVVTPLVSLMQDQVDLLPKCLNGGFLSNNQTMKQRNIVMNQLESLDVLFISPERLALETFLNRIARIKISFVCIDEIHCMSEWSHHFRISYWNLIDVLRQRLNVSTILGLTATATKLTQKSISERIHFNQVIQNPIERKNLSLAIKQASKTKLGDLLECIHSWKDKKSILVYVSTRFDAEMVSRYLNDKGINANFYHAGMNSRDKIQDQFMDNKIRVLVCTVAFGMGINKLDIDGVVHYTMPKSLEDYIQQVGRAGRNGNPSNCLLLYEQEDVQRQWSLAASDQILENEIKNLIERFSQSKNIIFRLEQDTDLRMEVIETIMSRLTDFFQFENGYSKCSIRVFRMSTVLEEDWLKNATKEFDKYTITFETMNQYLIAEQDLRTLAANGFISVDFTEECVFTKIKVKPKSIFDLVLKIHKELKTIQQSVIYKVYSMAKVCMDALKNPKSNIFDGIQDYFNVTEPMVAKERFYTKIDSRMEKTIEKDIKSLLSGSFIKNGKQIARILHGVTSPCFDSKTWQGQKCWKRYQNIDFDQLVELGTKVLKESK